MSAKDDLTIPLLPDRYYHLYNRGIDRQVIFYNKDNYRYFLRRYGERMLNYFDTFGYCLLNNHFHLFVRVQPMEEILLCAVADFDVVNESFYKDYVLPWMTRLGLTGEFVGLALGLDRAAERSDLTNFKNLLNLSLIYGDTITSPTDYPLKLHEVDFRTQLASWVVSERFRGFLLGYAKALNKQQNRTGSLFQKGFRRKYIMDEVVQKRTMLMYIHHNSIHHLGADNYYDYIWSSAAAYKPNIETKVCRDEALKWYGGFDHYEDFAEAYKNNKREAQTWMIEE